MSMGNIKADKENRKKMFDLLPAVLLLVFWPCIVHMNMVRTGLENQPWFPDTAVQSDFFLYAKSKVLLVLAGWMLLILLERYTINKEERFHRVCKKSFRNPVFICLVSFGILTILSAAVSSNRSFCFSFLTEQCENLWVILAYLIVFWFMYDTVRLYKEINSLQNAVLSGACIQCVIGISQRIGNDFWNSPIGRKLILWGYHEDINLEFTFASKDGTQVYMSLYNPNYAAVYIILILPLAVYAVIRFRKLWQKCAAGILCISLLYCLWGTESEAGFLMLLFDIGFSFIFFLRYRKRKRWPFILIISFGLLVIGIFLFSGNFQTKKIFKNVFPKKKVYAVKNIKLKQNEVILSFKKNKYKLRLEEENGKAWFSVLDNNNISQKLEFHEETGSFTLADTDYELLRFAVWKDGAASYIRIYFRDLQWTFVKEDQESEYQYITIYGKKDSIMKAPCAFAKGYERAFTERMYLWSRTVPLLKDYIFVGSGPNTFSLVFPQNDYVMRANIGDNMLNEIISKPHSFYLQTAVQTGCLSLLFLLTLLVVYIRKGWRQFHIGNSFLLISLLSFMIMGIVNDSTPAVSPIFWSIFGMACGYFDK